MLNQTAWWKYIVIILVIALGLFYALPNIFGSDPGIQVRGSRGLALTTNVLDRVEAALTAENIAAKSIRQDSTGIKIRFASTEDQLRSRELLETHLGSGYAIALTLLAGAPDWLSGAGALPMYLGLDLRGGVHFLLEVDMDSALDRYQQQSVDDFKRTLRSNRIRFRSVSGNREGGVEAVIRNPQQRSEALTLLSREYPDLQIRESENRDDVLIAAISDGLRDEVASAALEQNLTALRNRVDQLGVAEPVVQQQGTDRIVVQLPGVQDTGRAKEMLGRAATLQMHLVDETNNAGAVQSGTAPPGSALYRLRDGGQILLEKRVLYSGDNIIDAAASLSQLDGSPIVSITLDAQGSAVNSKVTGQNVNNRMAVVYQEVVSELERDASGRVVLDVSGQPQRVTNKLEEVITAPVIRQQLGKRYQIEGLSSINEARDLALLLRSGALAAPVEIIEERTVGPSLGEANIRQGIRSVVVGFILVLVFMLIYYRLFGFGAALALSLNLVLIIAVLSLLQATLTLPGVAGIVLTVGMAVDANVLIFERIREEIRNGNSPQASIHMGYDRALSTIIDANITTLIAAIVLFTFGTGPVKGFAVTLSIGIVTSMFTAIMFTRMLVNWVYGGRNVKQLAV